MDDGVPHFRAYQRNKEMAPGESLPEGVSRIALAVEYNGAAYCGWQIQKDPLLPTVQGSLERALSKVANEPIRVICAGRTDTGVHATNQIIHFDTVAKRDNRAWVFGANAYLEETAAVRWATTVPPQFHARFSAISRTYRYIIYNGYTRPAIARREMTWDFRALDVDKMQQAAQYLVGEHDFSAFRAAACQAKHPLRTVEYIRFKKLGQLIVFEVKANAFLQHMVRNFAGSLLAVGAGDYPPEWVRDVLQQRDRSLAGITASPNGLYLVAVGYNAQFVLPVAPKGPHFLTYLTEI